MALAVRWLRRVGGLVTIVVLALIVSAAAGAIGLAAAWATGSWPLTLMAAALGLVTLPWVPQVRRVCRRLRRGRVVGGGAELDSGSRRPVVVMALAAVLSGTWLIPSSSPDSTDHVTDTVQLPVGDGISLSVTAIRARMPTEPPLIVVHGGPGVADTGGDLDAFRRLAEERDVYVYDQLGAGSSTRLADPTDYTTERALEDLERVVARTGSRQVALLGHSWGARFVTLYAAAHPARVERLIVSSPGTPPVAGLDHPIGEPAAGMDATHRARLYAELLKPRNLFAYALGQVDLRLAHRAIGDEEMDHRFAAIYRLTAPGLFCSDAVARDLGVDGVGYYSHEALVRDADTVPASDLDVIDAPVLIVKPRCDYLPWADTAANLAVLPAARLVVLPEAGHQSYIERPAEFTTLIKAFLADQPLPLAAVRDVTTPPPEYRGRE